MQSGAGAHDVVPVVERWAQAHDGGMALDHGVCHGIAGGIGVKATVQREFALDKERQPCGVWSGVGGGDAPERGMDVKATDGIDGGLTEDDSAEDCVTDGEVAEIFL